MADTETYATIISQWHWEFRSKLFSSKTFREFPGGPVVRTLCFHCRGCGFNPWSGN